MFSFVLVFLRVIYLGGIVNGEKVKKLIVLVVMYRVGNFVIDFFYWFL